MQSFIICREESHEDKPYYGEAAYAACLPRWRCDGDGANFVLHVIDDIGADRLVVVVVVLWCGVGVCVHRRRAARELKLVKF